MNGRSSVSLSSAPIVIVGGGVIGVCLARSLALRGAATVVLERGQIGHGASFGNAGTVSPGHPPINGPGRWRELVRSMIDPLSPLYIAPRFDPGLFRWLLGFARHCSASHLEYCREVMAPLARVTPELHDAIAAAEGGGGARGGGKAGGGNPGASYGYRANGYLEVFRTAAGANVARHEAEFARGQGMSPREISRDDLRDREPALTDAVRGAYHYAEGRSMDPYGFVRAVAAQASAAGADVRSGVDVEAVLTENGRARGVRTDGGDIEASAVVLATGAYSADLYRRLGCPLPVIPAKGYHLDLASGGDHLAPGDDGHVPAAGENLGVNSPCLLVETSVFATPLPGRLRLAGTLEFSGVNDRIRRQRLEQLLLGARLYLDGLDGPDVATVSEWCGLRPCTPDGLPAVGPLPGWNDLYAATGHAMLGLTYGPITGEMLADLLVDGRRAAALTALDPARFLR